MKSIKHILLIIFPLLAATGCMQWDYDEATDVTSADAGLFIACEGNFQYGNASLSFYDSATGEVSNELFRRANGFRLGDVAQSMALFGGQLWIVVNNSHVVYGVDPTTLKEITRIEGLTSPRQILPVSETKAYISQLWDNRIFIVNWTSGQTTGFITVPEMSQQTGSTEQMVRCGDYVYCTCWSFNSKVIRINTLTDQVEDWIEVGVQPRYIVVDRYNKLWVLTDGGYQGCPAGYESPRLVKIDAETFEVEQTLQLRLADAPSSLKTNSDRNKLYWTSSSGVWQMDVTSTRLPVRPIITTPDGGRLNGLTISPSSGDIYVADALDYQQPGVVRRYSQSGQELDRIQVGVNPSAFCWK